MGRKIVVALGGNAILAKDASAAAQKEALVKTAKELVKFIKNEDQLVITHGNGPQVGNLLLQQQASDSKSNPAMPLDTCVAMTEGSIGYWLQNAMLNELKEQNISKEVVSLVTQVKVDKQDRAFENPTKPVGPFLTKEEADKKAIENPNQVYKEDAGRGFRRVVPSPKPIDILEKKVISQLVAQDIITISAGGGGIPVYDCEGKVEGIEAVIDKDYVAAKLAELIDADLLIILTAVDNVYLNYGKDNEQKLENITVQEIEKYIDEDQFAKGSMLPKVEAAISFAKSSANKQAVITSLDNVSNYLSHGMGTIIKN